MVNMQVLQIKIVNFLLTFHAGLRISIKQATLQKPLYFYNASVHSSRLT